MRIDEFSKNPVEFHEKLNPVLWNNFKLRDNIRYQLLLIAKHFAKEFDNIQIHDITISGSNAAYNYTRKSDIDLHLVVNILQNSDLEELYFCKKNDYNSKYDIKIKDIEVELYVQNAQVPQYSAGVYSVLNDQWISKPKKVAPRFEADEVHNKLLSYRDKIRRALKSSNVKFVKKTLDRLYRLRLTGLERQGEISIENIVFKKLRDQGQIEKLRQHINSLVSNELSLGEMMKIKEITLNEELPIPTGAEKATVTNVDKTKNIATVKTPSGEIKQLPLQDITKSNNQFVASVPPDVTNDILSGTQITLEPQDDTNPVAEESDDDFIGGDPTDDFIDDVTNNEFGKYDELDRIKELLRDRKRNH